MDELSWKDVKAGDEFELHPAFDRFLCAMKKEETLQPSSSTRSQEANLGSSVIREGFRYSKEFCVGRKGYDKLTDLQTQNATRPPTNRIRLMFTEWTKKSIRHFCRNHELYSFDWRYGYELKLPSMKIQDSSKLISGYSMPQSGTLVDEISDVITVGDLMELLETIHRDPYEYAHLNSRWTQLDHLQDDMGCWLEWQSEREFLEEVIEEVIEDDGWGSRVNWEDHFKRLRQDQYNRLKEQFTLENPPGTARLVLPTRESKPFKVGIDQSSELIMNLDGGEILQFQVDPLLELEILFGELHRLLIRKFVWQSV